MTTPSQDMERAKEHVRQSCGDSICKFLDPKSCGCMASALALIAQARAEERERCAKIAERRPEGVSGKTIAKVIRTPGEKNDG